MKYGCIGRKLKHSFSKEIHSLFADYSYELQEIIPEKLDDFMRKKDFSGINVTIPYKEKVIDYLDEISDKAKRIGAVNTIINKNGKLIGYNTDYFGMKALIEKNGISLKDKKVLVLGTGGTSKTARCVAEDMQAKEILVVSRSPKKCCITYDDVYTNHNDAEIIINTTPVGMYPDTEKSPLNLEKFNSLEGIVDAIYNPLKTNLVLQGKEKGIKSIGGLYMLVAQAVYASEKFQDVLYGDDTINSIYNKILKSKENIVLIGMPGSGKTTVGKELSQIKNCFYDSDEEIVKEINCSIKDYINDNGESCFRDKEEEIIKRLSDQTNCVISVGGGTVLREINIKRLKRNGKVIFLNTPLDRIVPTSDRPLSDTREKLEKLYNQRKDIYFTSADLTVTPPDGVEETVRKIKEMLLYEDCNN